MVFSYYIQETLTGGSSAVWDLAPPAGHKLQPQLPNLLPGRGNSALQDKEQWKSELQDKLSDEQYQISVPLINIGIVQGDLK